MTKCILSPLNHLFIILLVVELVSLGTSAPRQNGTSNRLQMQNRDVYYSPTKTERGLSNLPSAQIQHSSVPNSRTEISINLDTTTANNGRKGKRKLRRRLKKIPSPVLKIKTTTKTTTETTTKTTKLLRRRRRRRRKTVARTQLTTTTTPNPIPLRFQLINHTNQNNNGIISKSVSDSVSVEDMRNEFRRISDTKSAAGKNETNNLLDSIIKVMDEEPHNHSQKHSHTHGIRHHDRSLLSFAELTNHNKKNNSADPDHHDTYHHHSIGNTSYLGNSSKVWNTQVNITDPIDTTNNSHPHLHGNFTMENKTFFFCENGGWHWPRSSPNDSSTFFSTNKSWIQNNIHMASWVNSGRIQETYAWFKSLGKVMLRHYFSRKFKFSVNVTLFNGTVMYHTEGNSSHGHAAKEMRRRHS